MIALLLLCAHSNAVSQTINIFLPKPEYDTLIAQRDRYRKALTAERKANVASQAKYLQQLVINDTLKRAYSEISNQLSAPRDETRITNLENELNTLKKKLIEKETALSNLRKAYQHCRGEVFRLKGKRDKKSSGDAYPPY